MKEHITPQLIKEQWILGELDNFHPSAEDAARWRREIAVSNDEILSAYPPEKIVPQIMKKTQRSVVRFWSGHKVPAAIAAMLVLFIAWPFMVNNLKVVNNGDQAAADFGIRPKGNTGFRLYLENGDSYQPLGTGDTVTEGSVIQIALDTDKDRYGVLFSLDGNGIMTLHYPPDTSETDSAGTALPGTEGNGLLPYGYKLDDAPRFERFVFVVSGTPLIAQEILTDAEDVPRPGRMGAGVVSVLSEKYLVSDILLLKGTVN